MAQSSIFQSSGTDPVAATTAAADLDAFKIAAEAAQAAAEAAQSAAETAETNAETAETNAETAETNAATSESNAATSASDASTSATAASTSATNASTSASAAATSATNAAASETNASTSETNASTSASNASTSASNASTSETNAAASASAASTSATNAATSATAAQTAQTAAETAETNAETAETNAATSETNAASSASSASTSATAAASSASAASTSASNASTSETNASNSASAASTSASNASTSETNASNSASSATTSASNASTSASQAATSATNASNSATAAETAKTAAETAKTAAETAKAAVDSTFDNFDDRFLGTFTTANEPTTDNDGNALSVGAVYYNSTEGEVRFYNGSSWDAPATSAATSATNASNSASAASTSATNAATSATNAAASESNASTSATNASNSASAASTSETNASTSATSASTSASNAATSATNAASSASSASTSESNASTSETNASNSASAASTSATNASNSASAASTSATSAASSASSASTSATNAASSLSDFQALYRTGSSDPTTSLDTGDLFFNTSSNTLKVYTGSAWEQGVTAGSGFLPLTGGQLTGNLTFSGSQTVDGRDVSADGTKLDGIEASADVTDTANVTAAGALMDSEVTNLAQVKAFDSSDYATAAQGTTADAALPKAGGTMTGGLVMSGGNITVDSGYQVRVTSSGTGPSLDIAGGGPNLIRFRPSTGFSNTADGVDITYRTTPNDLLIERSENGNKIAEFGGDDGHVKLLYNGSDRIETTSSGTTVTGNITVTGTVDGRDVAADGTKLDGIETGADVTDTTNVVAALTAGSDISIAADGTIAYTGASDVVSDTTPQLGGNLDVNGNSIVSASNGNIAITPNGTGSVVIDGLSHPQADGTAGQFMKTDGAGSLSFATVASELVDDTTPQLGGDLDTNGNNIDFTNGGVLKGNVTVDNTVTGSTSTAHIDLKRTIHGGGVDTDYTYRLLYQHQDHYIRLPDTGVAISDIGGANDLQPYIAYYYAKPGSSDFGFPVSSLPMNFNVNSTTNGGVLKGETFGTGNNLILGTTTNASTANLKLQTNGADAVVIAADKDALFYGDIEIDGGANSDWAFNVDSNGDLIIKVGGTAKAKLDTSGNLTCVGNVTAYGTI